MTTRTSVAAAGHGLADTRVGTTSRRVQAARLRVLVAFDGSRARIDALALGALLALSETVDMLVLGSTRRGRLGRLSHPSLARGVLRDPPCAVTVVSHDPRDRARSAPGQSASSAHGRQSASGTLTRFTREPRRRGI
jgi:hypothetical protein